MKLTKLIKIIVLSYSISNIISASPIGGWDFNNGDLSSHITNGALLTSLSSLNMNSTAQYANNEVMSGGGFHFFDGGIDGLVGSNDKIPNDGFDGYGFGGNTGNFVMFLHRAEDMDFAPGQFTSFGEPGDIGYGDGSGDGFAPMSFSVVAKTDMKITGLEMKLADDGSGNDLYFSLHNPLSGSPTDGFGTVRSNQTVKQVLSDSETFTIGAGSSMTFTISLDSADFNSAHNIDSILLYGSAIPEISSSALLMGLCLTVSLTASRRFFYKTLH